MGQAGQQEAEEEVGVSHHACGLLGRVHPGPSDSQVRGAFLPLGPLSPSFLCTLGGEPLGRGSDEYFPEVNKVFPRFSRLLLCSLRSRAANSNRTGFESKTRSGPGGVRCAGRTRPHPFHLSYSAILYHARVRRSLCIFFLILKTSVFLWTHHHHLLSITKCVIECLTPSFLCSGFVCFCLFC